MIRTYRFMEWILISALLAGLAAGCEILPTKGGGDIHTEKIPSPINLLLPETLEIHPFTQTGSFDKSAGGVHARIQARDAFGDPTKAFGTLRFQLFEFKTQNQSQKGRQLEQWEVSISQPERNLVHWNRHLRSYEFKLGCNRSLTGRLVFVVTFTSPFTPRLSAERQITVGQ